SRRRRPRRAAVPGTARRTVTVVLVQPMPSLTDLALGLVTLYLVWRLPALVEQIILRSSTS
ncbi:MAG: hypothetical protein ACRDQI_08635, partial [Pseudonocardiaceae bacterium]